MATRRKANGQSAAPARKKRRKLKQRVPVIEQLKPISEIDPEKTTVADLMSAPQKLVKVTSAAIRKKQKERDRLEALQEEETEAEDEEEPPVRSEVSPKDETDDDDDDDSSDEDEDDDDEELEVRSIHDVADAFIAASRKRGDNFAYGDAVPHPADAPMRRDAPSVMVGEMPAEIESNPDLSMHRHQVLSNLEDVFAHYQFGQNGSETGGYFVKVKRKAPKTWGSWHCAGEQIPIRSPITMREFADFYGGGEYVLTVYGPPKKGGIYNPQTGGLYPKALSNDIIIVIPYDVGNYAGVPPNESASLVDVDPSALEDEDMRPVEGGGLRSVRATTQADAAIHKTNAEHDLKIREVLDRKEVLRAEAEAVKAQSEASVQIAREETIRAKEMATHDVVAQQLAASQETIKELQNRILEQASSHRGMGVEDFTKLMSNGNREEIRLLNSQLERMAEAHKSEMSALHERHLRELEREREVANRERETLTSRLEDLRRQAAESIERERTMSERLCKDAEERADRRVREAEDRAAREVDYAQRNFDRRIEDVEKSWSARLDEERRSHDREMTTRSTMFEMSQRTESTVFAAQKQTIHDELQRLQSENDRLKAEIAKKGDVVAQLNEVKQVASALGFVSKDEMPQREPGAEDEEREPGDWKQQLASAGIGALRNLPAMVTAAAAAVRRPGPEPTPPHAMVPPAAMMMAPPRAAFQAQQRLTFGDENGLANPNQDNYIYPVADLGNQSLAMGMPMQQPMMQQPMPMGMPMQQPMMQQPMPMGMPMQQPMQQQSAMVSPSSFAAPGTTAMVPASVDDEDEGEEEEAPNEAELDQQIGMFRPALEAAVNSGDPPEAFLQEIVKSLGGDIAMVKAFAETLSAERIVAAIRRAPDGARSPLVKLAGREWLAKLEGAVNALG